ncbi:acetate kinase [Lentimicrobium sp. L6]|uniref:acetate/propionate family kinase n=1 Tax=Lentimicrobium sp. L6 TaxID=2735916 RepID=UPI0015529D3B|nr:acetate kinase [Lentimicrobium sp. L6]NPD86742.1 acetate kinase [Lentimicrobium sp. L6]
MKIIVLNCGSSSLKYQLFDMPSQRVIAKGLVDKIGLKGSLIKHEMEDGTKATIPGEIIDHKQGIEYLLGILLSKKYGCMSSLDELKGVGHRVVHAGEKFGGSVRINDAVIQALEETIDLAPLHNPPNLDGIYAITALLPEIEQVGVFDTAFHQTMPDFSYLYGVPYSMYEKHGVRRYGFHGSSHKFVSLKAAALLGKKPEEVNVITCHLGNGGSIAAVKQGKSLDTSMGMTPIEGLMMGTRSGDLDVGALFHIIKKEELTLPTANTLINKFSGVLGVSGVSSDMRDVEIAAEGGHERAQLALKMYQYRVRKYIGSYAAAMGGVDAIVFTGGIGENDWVTRQEATLGLEFMGAELDKEINTNLRGKETIISTPESKVKIMLIPTNEELVIASDTFDIIDKGIDQL